MGENGGIVIVDFKGLFSKTRRAGKFVARHERLILDQGIREMSDAIVEAGPGDRGMFLGVEPSQQEMVALPSSLDNYLKCQLSIHGMEHYMDDYNLKLPTMEEARRVMVDMIERAERMSIEVNRKKSMVVSMSKPFRFLQSKISGHRNRARDHARVPGQHETSAAKTKKIQGKSGRRRNDRQTGGGMAAGPDFLF